MDSANTSLISWGFGLAAFGYLSFSAYLFSFGRDWRGGLRPRRMLAAGILSALWSLFSLLYTLYDRPIFFVTSSLLDVLRYGAWYAFLLALLSPLAEQSSDKPKIAPWLPNTCWLLVTAGVLLQIALTVGWFSAQEWIRISIFHGLTAAVIGLIVIEQLFRTVTEDSAGISNRSASPYCSYLHLTSTCFPTQ